MAYGNYQNRGAVVTDRFSGNTANAYGAPHRFGTPAYSFRITNTLPANSTKPNLVCDQATVNGSTPSSTNSVTLRTGVRIPLTATGQNLILTAPVTISGTSFTIPSASYNRLGTPALTSANLVISTGNIGTTSADSTRGFWQLDGIDNTSFGLTQNRCVWSDITVEKTDIAAGSQRWQMSNVSGTQVAFKNSRFEFSGSVPQAGGDSIGLPFSLASTAGANRNSNGLSLLSLDFTNCSVVIKSDGTDDLLPSMVADDLTDSQIIFDYRSSTATNGGAFAGAYYSRPTSNISNTLFSAITRYNDTGGLDNNLRLGEIIIRGLVNFNDVTFDNFSLSNQTLRNNLTVFSPSFVNSAQRYFYRLHTLAGGGLDYQGWTIINPYIWASTEGTMPSTSVFSQGFSWGGSAPTDNQSRRNHFIQHYSYDPTFYNAATLSSNDFAQGINVYVRTNMPINTAGAGGATNFHNRFNSTTPNANLNVNQFISNSSGKLLSNRWSPSNGSPGTWSNALTTNFNFINWADMSVTAVTDSAEAGRDDFSSNNLNQTAGNHVVITPVQASRRNSGTVGNVNSGAANAMDGVAGLFSEIDVRGYAYNDGIDISRHTDISLTTNIIGSCTIPAGVSPASTSITVAAVLDPGGSAPTANIALPVGSRIMVSDAQRIRITTAQTLPAAGGTIASANYVLEDITLVTSVAPSANRYNIRSPIVPRTISTEVINKVNALSPFVKTSNTVSTDLSSNTNLLTQFPATTTAVATYNDIHDAARWDWSDYTVAVPPRVVSASNIAILDGGGGNQFNFIVGNSTDPNEFGPSAGNYQVRSHAGIQANSNEAIQGIAANTINMNGKPATGGVLAAIGSPAGTADNISNPLTQSSAISAANLATQSAFNNMKLQGDIQVPTSGGTVHIGFNNVQKISTTEGTALGVTPSLTVSNFDSTGQVVIYGITSANNPFDVTYPVFQAGSTDDVVLAQENLIQFQNDLAVAVYVTWGSINGTTVTNQGSFTLAAASGGVSTSANLTNVDLASITDNIVFYMCADNHREAPSLATINIVKPAGLSASTTFVASSYLTPISTDTSMDSTLSPPTIQRIENIDANDTFVSTSTGSPRYSVLAGHPFRTTANQPSPTAGSLLILLGGATSQTAITTALNETQTARLLVRIKGNSTSGPVYARICMERRVTNIIDAASQDLATMDNRYAILGSNFFGSSYVTGISGRTGGNLSPDTTTLANDDAASAQRTTSATLGTDSFMTTVRSFIDNRQLPTGVSPTIMRSIFDGKLGTNDINYAKTLTSIANADFEGAVRLDQTTTDGTFADDFNDVGDNITGSRED